MARGRQRFACLVARPRTSAARAYLRPRIGHCTCVPGGSRRSIGGVAAANAVRSDGAQRHGVDGATVGCAGGPSDSPAGRQRHRRRRRNRRHAQRRLSRQRRHRWRSLRADLCGQREEGVSAQRERHRASGPNARADAIARLQSRSRQLRAWLRHAVGRHSHRHGARLAVGMAGSPHALRHEVIQRRAAAGDRLRRPGLSGDRGDRQSLADEERAPAPGLLHADRSGFRQDLLRERQATGDWNDLQKPRSGQVIPADSAAGARCALQRRDRPRDHRQVAGARWSDDARRSGELQR